MIVRGRVFPPAVYRRRRDRAAALIAGEHGGKIPLLLLGVPYEDAASMLQPPAGGGRQDPWFDYFTGCHEPDAAILIDPRDRDRDRLFLDPGDPARVVWDGERLGPGAKAARTFGVDACHDRAELKDRALRAAERAGGRIALCWRKVEPGFQSDAALRWRRRLRGVRAIDAEGCLVRLRMIKERRELDRLRAAVARTARTLKKVLPRIPKLGSESEVAAELVAGYTAPDYAHLAFAPIVGSGVRGATLHYKHNDRPLERRRPVLIDSGATCGGYCADVTRTLPQHGRFDDRRFREVYELVRRCNALGRKHARPGITLKELNEIAWEPILDAGFARHHGLSHHIGLDVHDPSDRAAPLAQGMVISNEPGVYLPDEGFGVRIEDDLAITADGCEELTRAIPKTIPALEKAMRR